MRLDHILVVGFQKFESLEQSFVLLYSLIVILCEIFWRENILGNDQTIFNFMKLTQHFIEPIIFLIAELQLETEFSFKQDEEF